MDLAFIFATCSLLAALLQEKCAVAHCEGHRSWVSSLAFDPYSPGGGLPGLYRLASVGQDAQMCLYDIQGPAAETSGDSPKASLMRKAGSQASLQSFGWQGAGSSDAAEARAGKPTTTSQPPGVDSSKQGLLPSPLRADMLLYEPLMQHRLHQEPLSDVLVTDFAIFTADATGCVRTWLRPTTRK